MTSQAPHDTPCGGGKAVSVKRKYSNREASLNESTSKDKNNQHQVGLVLKRMLQVLVDIFMLGARSRPWTHWFQHLLSWKWCIRQTRYQTATRRIVSARPWPPLKLLRWPWNLPSYFFSSVEKAKRLVTHQVKPFASFHPSSIAHRKTGNLHLSPKLLPKKLTDRLYNWADRIRWQSHIEKKWTNHEWNKYWSPGVKHRKSKIQISIFDLNFPN